VDESRLGAHAGIDDTTNGTYYFDAFASRRVRFIGPVQVVLGFEATPRQGSAPLDVTFTNSSEPAGSITGYLWDFGDGDTSTETDPVHTYSTNDVFTVTLTAIAGTQQASLTKTHYINTTENIFADGFESGDLSGWTTSVGDGDLNVTAGAALSGTYGLAITIDNKSANYVLDDSPAGEDRYRARFYFDPNDLTMGAGDSHVIFVGLQEGVGTLFKYILAPLGSDYQLRVGMRNDAGRFHYSSWHVLTDEPHTLEIDWLAATGVDLNDGYLTLYIDGALAQTISGLDTDTLRVDESRLGAHAGIDATTNGTYYFDAFASRRLSEIGP